MIQEAFVQIDWDEDNAQQLRDQRVAELQAQGYECATQTLYRILDGMPVYILEAQLPEPAVTTPRRSPKTRQRDDATPRRVPEFEVR